MNVLRQPACRQLEQFLEALFLTDELIELRFIESWVSGDKRRSRVVRAAKWLRREEFVSQHRDITTLARWQRANVYFGVCPRPKKGDSHDSHIQTVRCLWADIDDVTVQDAFERWTAARVPRPSLVVNSGSGIHAYWLLDHDVHSLQGLARITAMLPHFYQTFGGDHVQNLSRILRAPGTLNYKDARSGRPPRPCTLLACQPQLRYPLEAFGPWIEIANKQQRPTPLQFAAPGATRAGTLDVASARRTAVRETLRHFDRPSRDRSRRDFAVVCDLLRLGLSREEIWSLVAGSSKFESNGRPYFDLTFTSAQRSVLSGEATVSATPPSIRVATVSS